jgi:signal transduction histidine kinase
VEDIPIGIISSDPEFVQLVQSSISNKNPHQDHPRLILNHLQQGERLQLDNLSGNQVIIVDATSQENAQLLYSGLIDEYPELPIIIVETGQGNKPSQRFDSHSITFLSEDDIVSPVFRKLILSIYSESKLTQSRNHIQKKLNTRIKELQSIRQAGLHISENLSLEELLDGILNTALELTGADDCHIYLFEHGDLHDGTIWGFDNNLSDIREKRQTNDSTYLVTKGGNIHLVEDNTVLPLFIYKDWQGSIYDLDLRTRNSTIGGMTIGFRKTHHFSKSEKNTIQMLADQAAIAIENARLFKIANQLTVIDERNRIARELHDSVAQALYGIALFAKASQRRINQDKDEILLSQLKTVQTTALDALREMRLLLFELRPSQVENEGLIPALLSRLEAVEERSGISVEFTLDGNPDLPDPVQDALYRISQEALNNILKHSQANHLAISLNFAKGFIKFQIQDDGIGFSLDPQQKRKGLGLISMKERAEQIGGKININSTPGEGTTIIIEVPYEN